LIRRLVPWGAAGFFLLFTVAVTWPGMIPFNRVEPMVLGLPFNMVWIALWVVLSFVVLVLVDRLHEGSRKSDKSRKDAD
jgi:hypothetical protein